MSETAEWLDDAVSQVMNQLRQKPGDTWRDVYVWNDGTVTGPKDNSEERMDGLRLVGVFSPHESPSEAAVRETLRNGMREANLAAHDEGSDSVGATNGDIAAPSSPGSRAR